MLEDVPVSPGYSKIISSNFKVIFDGFETEKQAQAFADWYEGSGEQDAGNWLDSTESGLCCADVNMKKLHENGGFKANESGEITVPLSLYKRIPIIKTKPLMVFSSSKAER